MRFLVDGVLHKFSNGLFTTADKKVQEVLDKAQYVRKVAEEIEEKVEETIEAPKKRKTTAKAAE
jgi:hypothetical protein